MATVELLQLTQMPEYSELEKARNCRGENETSFWNWQDEKSTGLTEVAFAISRLAARVKEKMNGTAAQW